MQEEFNPDGLTISWSDMKDLVVNCFLATHGNPTDVDIDVHAAEVIGTAENPSQETFTRADVESFLICLPSKWLTHYPIPKHNGPQRREAQRAFLQELSENITNDEPPNALLPREEVLMMVQYTEAPTFLSNPVDTFIQVPPLRPFPDIVETLWADLCEPNKRQTTLSIEQFRVFFTWFYLLHFQQITVSRAEAAAQSTFYEFLDQRGEMSKFQFLLVLRHLCHCMARQREWENYMQKCIHATRAALAPPATDEGEAVEVPRGLLFFQHPEKVSEELFPRREVYDPNELFLPTDPRQWVQEEDEYFQTVSRNRLVIHGSRAVGKTRIGRVLADSLHAVHLDVLELAQKALKAGSALGQSVRSCIDEDRPIPLSLQSSLIREAISSPRVLYHGYVLSDSLCFTGKNIDLLTTFYQESGVLSECLPMVFVEVTAEKEILAKHAAKVHAQDHAIFEKEASRRAMEKKMSLETKQREARHQDIEAAILKAQDDIEALENRAAEVPPAGGANAAAAAAASAALEENEVAVNNQIAMLQMEINHLQEELREVDEQLNKEAQRLQSLQINDPEQAAIQAHQQDTAYLRYLIHLGRQDVLKEDACEDYDDKKEEAPLTTLPCIKRLMDISKNAHHSEIYTVDWSSRPSDIFSYLSHAASLKVPQLAVEPEPDPSQFPATVEGDQALGRQREENVLASGVSPSHTWKRFCPVTYTEELILLEGSPCYSCVFEGRFYCFASRDKLEKFMSHPHLYLRHPPVSRQQLFVIADRSLVQSKTFSVSAFIDKVSGKYQLHRMSFDKYYNGLHERREQQQEREAVYQRRLEYELGARELREERLVKRIQAELKLKKKTAKKPAAKQKGKGKDVAAAEQPVEVEDASKDDNDDIDEPVAVVERLEHINEAMLKKAKEAGRNAVPIALELIDGVVNLKQLELLMTEGVLPENVVYLENVPPEGTQTESENENEDPAAPQEKSPNEQEANTIQACMEQLANPPKEWKLPAGAVPQQYSIQSLNVFGKAEAMVLEELCMRLNAGSAPVETGEVNEELGEDEEDEEEDEDEDDDIVYPPLEKLDKETKPMKRYPHQFGSRLQYCPVTLLERGLILQGKHELCSKYLDELYCFATEEYKAKFDANPLHYIGQPVPRDIPPRFWVIGPEHSGRSTLAKALSEAHNVPFFTFTRAFLENVIDTAQSSDGGRVGDIFIPPQNPDSTYLRRAAALLKEVRDFAESQRDSLKKREEAEKIMAQREEAEEQEAESSDDSSDVSDNAASAEAAAVDEAYEEKLQEWLEFEPEDPEDRVARINEAYLRMAGCVTRLLPFEQKGYLFVFPPVAESDLDFVFDEGGIPELVLQVTVTAETLQGRVTAAAGGKTREEEAAASFSVTDTKGSKVDMTDEEWERLCRKRERELRRWRRRHIGADDPVSADDEDDTKQEAEGNREPEGLNEAGENAEMKEGDGLLNTDVDPGDLMEEMLEGLEERRVKVMKIRNDLQLGAVLQAANVKLSAHLDHRLSFFASPQVVFYDDVMQLLQKGKLRLTPFALEDPVALLEHRAGLRRRNHWKATGLAMVPEDEVEVKPVLEPNVVPEGEGVEEEEEEESISERGPSTGTAINADLGFADDNDEEMSELDSGDLEEMQERLDRRNKRLWRRKAPRCAVLYGHAYFFENDASLKKFLHNPLYYLEQPPLLPQMNQGPVVALYTDEVLFQNELDGEKQRGLAESIAYNLGCPLVSVSKLIAWAALNPILGDLAVEAVQASLVAEVEQELVEKLLIARLSSAEVKEKGAVLLNLPRNLSQCEALLKSRSAAPIVKSAMVFLGGIHEEVSEMYRWASPIIHRMEQHGTVELPVPLRTQPWSNANLNEMIQYIDVFVEHERNALLRSRRAFPIGFDNTFHTWDHIRSHLSDYQWYCPYRWVNDILLVCVRDKKPFYGAIYLDKFYFFSHPLFLQRFLLCPTEVADTTTARPLPPCLPEPHQRTADNRKFSVENLQFQGCCPVVLYDTRENRGLRAVLEPRAIVGSLDCVVKYDEKYYAMLNEENRTRFLMSPWTFVEGSFMPPPRKAPLTAEDLANGVSHSYFIQRQLYDAVAYAMLDAAAVRPKYPGLTITESALKFMALHMKKHNEMSNEIQKAQYAANMETYEQRATLYKEIGEIDVKNPESKEQVDSLCEIYDKMLQRNGDLDKLGFLHAADIPLKTNPKKKAELSLQWKPSLSFMPQSNQTDNSAWFAC